MPNNREWSILVWLSMALVWALCQPQIRSSLWGAIRAALAPKISVALLLMALWVFGEVWLGSEIGAWRWSLATATATWFVLSAFIRFLDSPEAIKTPRFFRRKMLATLEVGILAEVITGTFVLPLFAELVLIPAVTVLGLLAAFSSTDKRYVPAKPLFVGINATAGLCLLGYAMMRLVSDWGDVDKPEIALQLVLPIWLSLGLIPYVYLLGLYSAYEQAFMRIDWKSPLSRGHRLGIKGALLFSFHMKAHELGQFTGPWQIRIAEATSFKQARAVTHEFKRAQPRVASKPRT